MSVLIKDMGKPKSCCEVIDGEYELCPFVNTDDDCVLLLNEGVCEGTWKEQYSKCPLVETPEPCEDAVSRADVEHEIANILRGVFVEYQDIAKKTVSKLPSVTPKAEQPEIIRCRECKYGEQDEEGRWFCGDLGCSMGNDDGSGFCSDAERREEGEG